MVELTLSGPVTDREAAWPLLDSAIEAAGLGGWFDCRWTSGEWQLCWEEQPIWMGSAPNAEAWRDALLEAWWGAGGGCC